MERNPDFSRLAIRAAAGIQEHLLGPARLAQLPALPTASWQKLSRKFLLYEEVRRRGWLAAQRDLQIDLSSCVRRLARELAEYESVMPAASRQPTVSTHRDIASDLVSLRDEFGEVAIDLRERTVAVVTRPIWLEDLHLGPFQIRLYWQRVGLARAYDTRALAPHRPQLDQEVTHPHVRKHVLCEGDGAAAIKAALTAGRLLDFFLLVNQILKTYNEGSAYVSLSRWSGVPCVDCGEEMDDEGHGLCDRCDAALCGNCSMLCGSCDRYVCASCTYQCSGCSEHYCRSCLSDGPHSTLYCEACLEKPGEVSSDQPFPAESETQSAPAADTVCLGQTALPA